MSEGLPADPPPQPKADPESFVLRARPQPVVRFRRGLIIGAAAALGAGLIALAWLALEPPAGRWTAVETDEPRPARPALPDALAGMPASYGEVPPLGPPLPGDLGRAIVERERSLAASRHGADPATDAAAAERQRRVAAEEAARASAMIVPLTDPAARPESPREADVAAAAPSLPAAPASVEGVREEPAAAVTDVSVHELRAAPSPWTLSAGTIIAAALLTGLNSDLPGIVLAQVTEPVRDSATGGTVLIPQGSRLIGRYDNVVAYGQRRALVAWQRIVLPDGTSIRLEDMPASDPSGHAGLEDEVDAHTGRLLKGIALSTLLGVGTEISLGGSESDLVRAVRESGQQNAARAGDRITQRNLDIRPTITVRPGWRLRAIVHKDIVLRPWQGWAP